jgi:hypothetical protein
VRPSCSITAGFSRVRNGALWYSVIGNSSESVDASTTEYHRRSGSIRLSRNAPRGLEAALLKSTPPEAARPQDARPQELRSYARAQRVRHRLCAVESREQALNLSNSPTPPRGAGTPSSLRPRVIALGLVAPPRARSDALGRTSLTLDIATR